LVQRTTIAGETEVLGENLPSATLSHHKSHIRFRTPDRSGGKPATNRLSYGAAFFLANSITDLNGVCELMDCSATVFVDEFSNFIKFFCRFGGAWSP
jgi:hypothetical protein